MRTPSRSGISLFTLVAASALLLTGCAPTVSAAQPSPTPVPSVSASPTPSAPVLTAPAQVFDGSCAQIFSDTDVSDALGVSVTATVLADAAPSTAAVAEAGGVRCGWAAEPEGDPQVVAGEPVYRPVEELSMTALPDSLRPDSLSADPNCYVADDLPSCGFDLIESGIWVSGIVRTPAGSTEDDAKAAVDTLSAKLSVSAGGAAVAAPTAPVDGAWSMTSSCGDLASSAPLAEVLPGWTATENDRPGERPAGYLTSERATGMLFCSWAPPADGTADLAPFEIETLPGGAWAASSLTAATELAVEGVDRAFFDGPEPHTTLQAIDGPNWVRLFSDSTTAPMDASFAPIVSAIVQALNDGLAG